MNYEVVNETPDGFLTFKGTVPEKVQKIYANYVYAVLHWPGTAYVRSRYTLVKMFIVGPGDIIETHAKAVERNKTAVVEIEERYATRSTWRQVREDLIDMARSLGDAEREKDRYDRSK